MTLPQPISSARVFLRPEGKVPIPLIGAALFGYLLFSSGVGLTLTHRSISLFVIPAGLLIALPANFLILKKEALLKKDLPIA
jgi:hydrogenase/urease accessory protein HupE